MQDYAIGVDLGGTKIEIGLVNNQGKIIDSIKLFTDVVGGPSAITQQIVKAVDSLCNKNPTLKPKGMGIGIPGQVDSITGTVAFAPNLGWHQFPIREMLSKQLNLPTVVTNDLRMITFGEWLHGGGRNCDNFICVFVGTGIGSGIVVNGRLLTGISNTAGEIGHMIISLNGPRCTCGRYGCLEALAGGWAIERAAQAAVAADRMAGTMMLQMVDNDVEKIIGAVVTSAFHQGDPLAKSILERATQALITGMINVVNLLNPQRIVLGGGVIHGFPGMIELVEKGVRAGALEAAVEYLEIVPSELAEGAGIIGAASLAMENFP
jgi:glucokinase